MILSILPGRSNALSIISGRFVAATIMTSLSVSTPSNSVSNCVRTRSDTLEAPLSPPLPRGAARASISSKKTMEGAAARAF